YRQPPDVIRQILDAPATPTALLSPDHQWTVLLDRPGLAPISVIAAPEYRVAGLRLNPRTSGPSRQHPSTGMSIMPAMGGDAQRVAITLPKDGGISYTNWSPDGKRLAFVVSDDSSLTLWMLDVATREARQVSDR